MRAFILIILLCSMSHAFSQEEWAKSSKWGEPFKTSSISQKFTLGKIDGEIWMLEVNGKKNIVRIFDESTIELKNSKQITLEYNGQKLDREGQFILQNQLFFYSSYKNTFTKKEDWYVQRYDKNEGLSKTIQIASVDLSNITIAAATDKAKENAAKSLIAVQTAESPDGTKFCVLFPTDKVADGSSHWKASVYTHELSELWSFDFELPDLKGAHFTGIQIDNAGNLFALGMTNFKTINDAIKVTSKEKKVYELTGDNLFLVHIDGEGKEMTKERIYDVTNVTQSAIQLVANGVLVYGLTGDFLGDFHTGIFYTKFNSNGETRFSHQIDFFNSSTRNGGSYGYDFKSRVDETISAEKRGFSQLMLRNMVELENGNFFILAERFGYQTTSRSNPEVKNSITFGSSLIYEYILIANCTSKGTLEWMDLIDKTQDGMDGKYHNGTFVPLVRNNTTYLLYNTLAREGSDLSKGVINPSKSANKNINVLQCSIIPEKGKITHKVIAPLGEGLQLNGVLLPKASMQLDSEQLFTFLWHHQLGLIPGIISF